MFPLSTIRDTLFLLLHFSFDLDTMFRYLERELPIWQTQDLATDVDLFVRRSVVLAYLSVAGMHFINTSTALIIRGYNVYDIYS